MTTVAAAKKLKPAADTTGSVNCIGYNTLIAMGQLASFSWRIHNMKDID